MNNKYKLDKKAKIERLNKAKKIGFIISLAFNALFILLLIIGLALPKAGVHETNNEQNSIVKVMRQTNNAFGDRYSNLSVKSWDFTKLKEPSDYRSINVAYILSQDAVIVNYDSPVASANYLVANGVLHSPIENGDYVEVSAHTYDNGSISGNILYIKHQYSYEYGWTTINYPLGTTDSYYNSSNGFSLVFNKELTGSNDFSLEWLDMFEELGFKDYDLNYNWSPFMYYDYANQGFMGGWVNESASTSTYVRVIHDTTFSIYGNIYTSLRFYYQDNGRWESQGGSNTKVVYPVKIYQRDGSSITINDQIHWVSRVIAVNEATDKGLTIWQNVTHAEADGSTASVLRPFATNNFIDKNFALIRLFDVNSEATAIAPYTIGSFFDASFDYSSLGGYGDFGDVFGLITTSFNGLTGLLSINLLPNITIGMLLFLPLVALIVFAILKVVKK